MDDLDSISTTTNINEHIDPQVDEEEYHQNMTPMIVSFGVTLALAVLVLILCFVHEVILRIDKKKKRSEWSKRQCGKAAAADEWHNDKNKVVQFGINKYLKKNKGQQKISG